MFGWNMFRQNFFAAVEATREQRNLQIVQMGCLYLPHIIPWKSDTQPFVPHSELDRVGCHIPTHRSETWCPDERRVVPTCAPHPNKRKKCSNACICSIIWTKAIGNKSQQVSRQIGWILAKPFSRSTFNVSSTEIHVAVEIGTAHQAVWTQRSMTTVASRKLVNCLAVPVVCGQNAPWHESWNWDKGRKPARLPFCWDKGAVPAASLGFWLHVLSDTWVRHMFSTFFSLQPRRSRNKKWEVLIVSHIWRRNRLVSNGGLPGRASEAGGICIFNSFFFFRL